MGNIADLTALLASAAVPAHEQEQADTLTVQELNEVVAQAHMQQASATSSTLIPNKRQKSSGQKMQ